MDEALGEKCCGLRYLVLPVFCGVDVLRQAGKPYLYSGICQKQAGTAGKAARGKNSGGISLRRKILCPSEDKFLKKLHFAPQNKEEEV